jgi:Ni/Co efflux regulator RcnB
MNTSPVPQPAPQAQPTRQVPSANWEGRSRGDGQNWNGRGRGGGDWNRGNRGGEVRPQQPNNGTNWDRNGNGRVDRDWDRNRNGRVDRVWDRDRDGNLDRRWDRNGNGTLDRRYDRNGDGRYDRNRNDNRGYGYGNNNQRWDRSWHNDRRYDWRGHRNQYRNLYRAPNYYNPYGRGYGYNRFSIGIYLDSLFYSNRYWINDPWQYRLPQAYGSYRWVRYYDDVLLIDTRTGYVVDVINNFFW